MKLPKPSSLPTSPVTMTSNFSPRLEVNCRVRVPKTPLFGRAYGGAYLGLLNKYDGSTQAVQDPIDSVYYVEPLEFRKTNSFFRIGLA